MGENPASSCYLKTYERRSQEKCEFCSEQGRYCLRRKASRVSCSYHLTVHKSCTSTFAQADTELPLRNVRVLKNEFFFFKLCRHTSCTMSDNLMQRWQNTLLSKPQQKKMTCLNFQRLVLTTRYHHPLLSFPALHQHRTAKVKLQRTWISTF